METKEILRRLREEHDLTQEAMAQRLHLSRQAVSRWETGETLPSVDTLQLISQVFSVSVDTLLGADVPIQCQCCGMPLQEAEMLSSEPDGTPNRDYCKWCYHDGRFVYDSMDTLIDFCAPRMAAESEGWSEEAVRAMMCEQLPRLKHWRTGEDAE